MTRPLGGCFAFSICVGLLAGVAAAQTTQPAGGEGGDMSETLTPGVTLRVYEIAEDLTELPELVEDQTPNFDEVRDRIDFNGGRDFGDTGAGAGTSTYARAVGFLDVAEPGDYTFRLISDDGSRLLIDGEVVVDHNGTHGVVPMEGEPLTLEAGLHELLVEHFDHGGGRELHLEWKTPDADDFVTVPAEAFKTENDPTRVTSPGFKQIVGGRRPGDGRPLVEVHPGWDLTTIRPEGFEPMVGAMTFLPDGRLVVGTFSPLQRDNRTLPDIESKEPDKLHALSGVDGDPADVTVEVVADGLYEPTGMTVYDGDLYVSNRRSIVKLTDTDGDGFFETHETVGEGWEGWNYHQFAFGLLGREGKLYTALSTTMAPPAWEGMETNSGPNGPMRGSVLEIDLSSGDTHVYAGGTRTPNGLGWGPDGSMMYLDNQGTWMSTSQLAEVIPGRFYGHHNWTRFVPNLADRFPEGGYPSALSDRPRTPAAIYLPQNELSNSPTQPELIEEGPFAGQMYIGELTGGGIRRAFLEKVNGQWQGAAFRFTQGLESGVNRLVWGPDGSLYAGGIGALGNWNWRGTKYGLQRLTPNGTSVFEMLHVSATPDGFEVAFTKPVDAEWLKDPENYKLSQWRYVHTKAYGGPKIDEETLTVAKAEPGEDGTSVRLTVDGLKKGFVVYLRTDPTSTDGSEIWSTEAWYTLNEIPTNDPAKPSSIAGIDVDPSTGVGVGVLPSADAVPLISSSADVAFSRANAEGRPANRSDDDLMALPGYDEVGNGDFVSHARFGDARIHLEFYCPPGGEGQMAGNSGVYLQGLYELQILGTKPGDGSLENNELGGIYQKKAADINASTGPGTWQAYDLWFKAPRFENGEKTSSARLTAYLNGVLIHDDVEIDSPTGSKARDGEPGGDPVQLGPLVLQDHGTDAEGPVRFRNVWIAPLEPAHYDEGAWTNLLEGDSLDGWVVRGGDASYEIEDGVVTGTSKPNTPNTFLTTEQAFGDFELLLEAKQDPRLNSGIQIRSNVDGGIDRREGRLVGYQVELDPGERAWSAGIYDEARRGWLYPLSDAPYARRAYRPDDWNKIRVVAKGDVIQTWINGIPAASLFDAVDPEGHIALQVHSVGDDAEPMTVQFRNVRLRELTASE